MIILGIFMALFGFGWLYYRRPKDWNFDFFGSAACSGTGLGLLVVEVVKWAAGA